MRLGLLFFFIISLCLPGCAESLREQDFFQTQTAIQWPEPPLKPRIQYVRAIAVPRDIAIAREEGWFGKTVEWVTGGERSGGLPIATPYGLYYDDAHEVLYAADRALKGIHRYNLREGESDLITGGDEGFEMPVAVVLAEGKLYVSDALLKKVFILTADGKKTGEIGGWERPGGMAYDSKRRRLYVVDVLAHQVRVHDPEGKLLSVIGGLGDRNGEFYLPSNVWVDKAGRLYVTDSMNFRVQSFDEKGNHRFNIGQLGDGSGDLARPRGVAVDSDGNIYIVDAKFHNVQIFDQQQRLLLYFGQPGEEAGRFNLPSGIFIDGNDRIFISDSYNRRIQIFRYIKGRT